MLLRDDRGVRGLVLRGVGGLVLVRGTGGLRLGPLRRLVRLEGGIGVGLGDSDCVLHGLGNHPLSLQQRLLDLVVPVHQGVLLDRGFLRQGRRLLRADGRVGRLRRCRALGLLGRLLRRGRVSPRPDLGTSSLRVEGEDGLRRARLLGGTLLGGRLLARHLKPDHLDCGGGQVPVLHGSRMPMNVALGLSLTLPPSPLSVGGFLLFFTPRPSSSRSRHFHFHFRQIDQARGTRGAGKAREAEAGARKTDTLSRCGAVRVKVRGWVDHSLARSLARFVFGLAPARTGRLVGVAGEPRLVSRER